MVAPPLLHNALLRRMVLPALCLRVAEMRCALVALGADQHDVGSGARLIGLVAGANDPAEGGLLHLFTSAELQVRVRVCWAVRAWFGWWAGGLCESVHFR